MSLVEEINKIKRKKPNLIVPGAAKSGTSSLHEYLNTHKDIYMSRIKEPHYFSNEHKYYYEKLWYYSLFKTKDEFKYLGESSTGYMVLPNVIERIKKELNNPKFIFILRNPIDRLYSHYWWLRGQGYEMKSFKKAVLFDVDVEPIAGKTDGVIGYKNYFQWGLYGKWIKRYHENFPRRNIFIITFENLIKEPLKTMNSCFKFLDLKELDNIGNIQTNKTIIIKNAYIYGSLEKIARTNSFLKNLLRKNDYIRKLSKSLLYKIKKRKEKLITNIEHPKMDIESRIWAKNLYFEDFLILKEVTKMEFTEWEDFKSINANNV
jgi:hypothetical protein